MSELGYTPFQGPPPAMTRDYNNLYKVMLLECHRGGFCSSHVCSQGAKGESADRGAARALQAEDFELRPLCNVIKVNTDSTGKQATGVTYIDARGREVEQPASIVVLATYCFNTRLLLLSGIGKPPIRRPAAASSAATIRTRPAAGCTCSSMTGSSTPSSAAAW